MDVLYGVRLGDLYSRLHIVNNSNSDRVWVQNIRLLRGYGRLRPIWFHFVGNTGFWSTRSREVRLVNGFSFQVSFFYKRNSPRKVHAQVFMEVPRNSSRARFSPPRASSPPRSMAPRVGP